MRADLVFAVMAALSDVVRTAHAGGKSISLGGAGHGRAGPSDSEVEDLRTWLEINKIRCDGDLLEQEYLDLSYKGLEAVHDVVWKLHKLRILNLAGNKLDSLPDKAMEGLINLRVLFLGENPGLKPLPTGLLSRLAKFVRSYTIGFISSDLYNIQVACPSKKVIGDLPGLIALDLSDNHFGSLPEGIFQLYNLEELFLSRMHLASLPGEVGGLKKLKMLSLAGTGLTSLPNTIAGLGDSLVYLNLRDNPLDEYGTESRLGWRDLYATFDESVLQLPDHCVEKLSKERQIVEQSMDG